MSKTAPCPSFADQAVRGVDSLLPGNLLSVNRASEEYPLSKSQLRHLIAERRIPYYKMLGQGGRPHAIRLDRRDLDALFVRVEPAAEVA